MSEQHNGLQPCPYSTTGWAHSDDQGRCTCQPATPQAKPTDTQGEGWRYFVMRDNWLYRVKAAGFDEMWRSRGWRSTGKPWSLADHTGSIFSTELTEAEAVERFGPEIRDEQDKGEGLYLNGKKLPTHGPCPATTEDDTPHARALRELDLQPGDRVRVDRKVGDGDGGWGCNWMDFMDAAVGRIAPVESVCDDNGVALDCPDITEINGGVAYFPAHALSLVSRKAEEEQPQPREIETLADVEPWTLVVLESCAQYEDVVHWHDGKGQVCCRDERHQCVAVAMGGRPLSAFQVHHVVGPMHVSAETRSKSVADAEREELRELRAKCDPLDKQCDRLAELLNTTATERDELEEKLGRLERVVAPCNDPAAFMAAIDTALRILTPKNHAPQVRIMLANARDYYAEQQAGGER